MATALGNFDTSIHMRKRRLSMQAFSSDSCSMYTTCPEQVVERINKKMERFAKSGWLSASETSEECCTAIFSAAEEA